MNVKTWAPLGLAVVLGLVAMMLAARMTSAPQTANHPGQTMGQVAVARMDIPAGQPLTEADLKLGAVSADATPAGSFPSVAAAVGRVAQVPIVKGQPVIEAHLAPLGAGSGLQALIPLGMRAVTIEVNEFSGLAGMISPGCRVDVLATIQSDSSNEMLARTIVQNVEVRAIGQRTSGPSQAGNDPQPFRSVTLLATPEQAEAIELAAASARPRLVLRSGRDDAIAQTPGATFADLRGKTRRKGETGPISVPVARPTTRPDESSRPLPTRLVESDPSMRTVQLIRGGTESIVQFEISPEDPAWTTSGTEMSPAMER